jgi:hypothetical protein
MSGLDSAGASDDERDSMRITKRDGGVGLGRPHQRDRFSLRQRTTTAGGSDIACSADGAPSFVWTSAGQQPLPMPSGGLQPFGPESFRPVCWVGHDHLLLESRSLRPVLLDMRNGSTRPIDVQGDWAAGAIPGAF